MPEIRTTFEPDKVITVDDREAAELESQGLIFHTKATTDEGARRAAEKKEGN